MAILIIDSNGKLVDWNNKFLDICNFSKDSVENRDESISFNHVLAQLKNPEEVLNQITELYDKPEASGSMGDTHFIDGTIVERYTQPHRINNKIVGRVWSFRDVTEKRAAEEKLKLYKRAIDSSNNGVILMEATDDYRIIYANHAFCHMSEYDESDIINARFDAVFSAKDDAEHPDFLRLQLAISEKKDTEMEVQSFKKTGEPYWIQINIAVVLDYEKNVSNYVALINDITLRKRMESQLLEQATHDSLTNLPNRSLLLDRMQEAINNSKYTDNKKVAVLYLDLDDFKLINDTLGHSFGDKILCEVAQRLVNMVPHEVTVGRIGGDEFILLITNVVDEIKVSNIASNLLNEISKPCLVDGHNLMISSSIGIALYPNDENNVEGLMKCADMAMYHAKELGRNNYQFYTSSLNQRIKRRLLIEQEIRKAIKNDSFTLFYQPLIAPDTRKIRGLEALIRWPHEELGHIRPDEFIPIAEETGLILELTEWILLTACKQIKQWSEQFKQSIYISVNLTARDFQEPELVEKINNVIAITKIDPSILELELTERILVTHVDSAMDMMKQLKSIGVKISIDDFGVGYSSLNYLKQFPVDKLKIDGSFIRGITPDKMGKRDAAIIRAIIDLAHSLEMKTVAEGVETAFQQDFLRQLNCDLLQGYYFSKPIDAIACTQFMEQYLRSLER